MISDPSADFWPLVQPLWEYLALAETPRPADVIFVFGSRDLAVPARAATLFHEGHAPQILVTGSYGRMTRDVFLKPEALVFRDQLVEAGVPSSAILTEPVATNTLENVRLGIETLRRVGRLPATALLVAKGFVMRRCVATFARQCGEMRVCACPPDGGVATALDRSPIEFALRLVAEIDRLERYAKSGDIQGQEIPLVVHEAARRLTARVAFSGMR
jgi:uncharacterized SAM-binding protein YcdF (DUF218 family)